MHAHKVKTPTLNITGALDRCTPPGEACSSTTHYSRTASNRCWPSIRKKGTGFRKLPAAIDYTARVVSWFQEHIASQIEGFMKLTT